MSADTQTIIANWIEDHYGESISYTNHAYALGYLVDKVKDTEKMDLARRITDCRHVLMQMDADNPHLSDALEALGYTRDGGYKRG